MIKVVSDAPALSDVAADRLRKSVIAALSSGGRVRSSSGRALAFAVAWCEENRKPYIIAAMPGVGYELELNAPERSKEETVGVLSVPDAMAQLAAAIEAEKRRNAVRDEMLATVIVNLEKSEMTAEFAVLLRDYVRAERAKLSALETPEAAKHSDECGCGYCT